MKSWFVILILPLAVFAQLDVVFMLASNGPSPWLEAMDFLVNDPRFGRVEYILIKEFTPPLDVMQQYDVIFTTGDNVFDQEAFGDNLADYVDNGGFVVPIFYMLAYHPGYGIGGRWLEEGYSPYEPILGDWWDWFRGRYLDLNILEPEHPVFQDVSHLSDVWCHILFEGLRPGAHEIADFIYYPGIAINADDTVVALDYPISSGAYWTGDGFLIMANAACYLAGYSEVREASWGQIKAAF